LWCCPLFENRRREREKERPKLKLPLLGKENKGPRSESSERGESWIRTDGKENLISFATSSSLSALRFEMLTEMATAYFER